jgi:catechol 2,3-dioxygenase-like lactoylglutathione lyase family enzyme
LRPEWRAAGAREDGENVPEVQEAVMYVEACVPVIPSGDLEKSLRFWVEGLGLEMERPMRVEGRLVGCMVRGDRMSFWLNRRAGAEEPRDGFEGIRLYWAPRELNSLRERLARLGFEVSPIEEREHGQTEFFVTDDDGHSHCFGVATESLRRCRSDGEVVP